CVQPFVCAEYEGKRGTFAIMADGKVRFIPDTINPKTFQALCTIAGDDEIKDLDTVAPEVPPPDEEPMQPELKAEPLAPPAPPPTQEAKEEKGQDLQKLQGTWTLVAAEGHGQSLPAKDVQELGAQLVVTGDKYVITTGTGKEGGTLKLDETKTPKEAD